ncbi:MAG: terminase family protein [Clostridia bacterium]|nr:terminase family protein [Clostridia bacterium]
MTVPEIINEINLIESEQKRRRRECKIDEYNAGEKKHLKQIAFHQCDKKNRWVFGGNRSGKTECGAVETVWLARGIHPYKENKPRDGWVVSLSQQVQRDVAQNKILSYLKKDWIEDIVMISGKKGSAESGVIDTIYIKNVFGSVSKIGFKSCDQGREKFQGTSLDFVWFDEEPPEDIYIECKMRVLDKCGEVFGTMTPLKGLTWVYRTIYLNESMDPDVWYEQMEWADNPYLSKDEIEKFSKFLSQEELLSRKYGGFASGMGLVYSEFDERVNVIEPFEVPIDWYDKISIDPGLHNPLSCHWYACDYDGNVFVIAEHYDKQKTVEYHAERIRDISNRLKWPVKNGRLEAIIDSAANQKTLASEKSVTELFYDYGIIANPYVNKDLFAGINRVKSYFKNALGERKLFIFKNCVNMIREIKGYFWGNNDAPVKKDDHAMDELRYYIMSRPENKEKKTGEKSIISRNKEKLIRQHRYSDLRYKIN